MMRWLDKAHFFPFVSVLVCFSLVVLLSSSLTLFFFFLYFLAFFSNFLCFFHGFCSVGWTSSLLWGRAKISLLKFWRKSKSPSSFCIFFSLTLYMFCFVPLCFCFYRDGPLVMHGGSVLSLMRIRISMAWKCSCFVGIKTLTVLPLLDCWWWVYLTLMVHRGAKWAEPIWDL